MSRAAMPRQRNCSERHWRFNVVSWGRSTQTRQLPHITSVACRPIRATVIKRSRFYERLLTTGCPPEPISPSKRILISNRSMATRVSPLSWPTPKSAPPRRRNQSSAASEDDYVVCNTSKNMITKDRWVANFLSVSICVHLWFHFPLHQHRSEEHTSELQSLRHLVC